MPTPSRTAKGGAARNSFLMPQARNFWPSGLTLDNTEIEWPSVTFEEVK